MEKKEVKRRIRKKSRRGKKSTKETFFRAGYVTVKKGQETFSTEPKRALSK